MWFARGANKGSLSYSPALHKGLPLELTVSIGGPCKKFKALLLWSVQGLQPSH